MTVFLVAAEEESVYSALFYAFTRREFPDAVEERAAQIDLFARTVEPERDPLGAERVRTAIRKYGGGRAEREVSLVLRSGDRDRAARAFFYLLRLLKERRDVRQAIALPEVFAFEDCLKRVCLEAHRMEGFLRFRETASGALIARYSPANDVTGLILPHFVERFRPFRFAICDEKRNVVGMWNGEKAVVTECDREVTAILAEGEGAVEELWRTYYDAVTVAARPHDALMRGYMPRRYWTYLPEKKPRVTPPKGSPHSS